VSISIAFDKLGIQDASTPSALTRSVHTVFQRKRSKKAGESISQHQIHLGQQTFSIGLPCTLGASKKPPIPSCQFVFSILGVRVPENGNFYHVVKIPDAGDDVSSFRLVREGLKTEWIGSSVCEALPEESEKAALFKSALEALPRLYYEQFGPDGTATLPIPRLSNKRDNRKRSHRLATTSDGTGSISRVFVYSLHDLGSPPKRPKVNTPTKPAAPPEASPADDSTDETDSELEMKAAIAAEVRKQFAAERPNKRKVATEVKTFLETKAGKKLLTVPEPAGLTKQQQKAVKGICRGLLQPIENRLEALENAAARTPPTPDPRMMAYFATQQPHAIPTQANHTARTLPTYSVSELRALGVLHTSDD
jgi:hypothetical protein